MSAGDVMPDTEAFRARLEFVSTAQMSVDAQSALGSLTMNTFHLAGDAALIVVGTAFALVGYVIGYFIVILGLIFLSISQVAPFQRWLVNRYRGSLLNQPVTVNIDEEGLRFATPLASTTVPWATMTTIRTSDRSIVFLRGRSPLGYLPSAAFLHDAERTAFVEYARARITAKSAMSSG
jgi:hypothetical protein